MKRRLIDTTGPEIGFLAEQLRHLASWHAFGEVLLQHMIETAEVDEIFELSDARERWKDTSEGQAAFLLCSLESALLDGRTVPEDAEPGDDSDPKDNRPWARMLLGAIDPEFAPK